MKKTLAFLLMTLVLLSVVACGGGDKQNGEASSSSPASKTVSETASEGDIVVEVSSEAAVSSAVSETSSAKPSATLPSSGFCAVGIVKASSKTATILADNGVIKSVGYTGDAPKPGGVYSFKKSGSKYKFEEVQFVNGSALQDPAWGLRMFDYTPTGAPDLIYTHDGTNERMYNFKDDTVVFCRYSETEWRLFKGKDIIRASDYPFVGYFATEPDPAGGYDLVTVVLAGDFKNGKIAKTDKATTFFLDPEGYGWPDGDITIK